jgi:hypothetical protein
MRIVPFLVLTILLLSGCFRTNTVVYLNADGSGTIEETVLLAAYALNMIQEMDSSQVVDLIDEEKLIARQDSLGEGVVYEGVEAIDEDGFIGYIAVYSFSDINLVHLQDNSEALQLSDDSAEESSDEDDPMSGLGLDNVTFSYQPGVLEVHIPHATGEESEIHPDTLAAETEKIRSQMHEQGGLLRAFLTDARVSVSIVLPGAITETNASFADSTTVTLADILFGSMLDLMAENPEAAARMQLAQSEGQRRAFMADMGESADFRFETNNTVRVLFD